MTLTPPRVHRPARDTLDKTMNGRKTWKPGQRQGPGGGEKQVWQGEADSDRKHLTGREVERLIEATKGGGNEAATAACSF